MSRMTRSFLAFALLSGGLMVAACARHGRQAKPKDDPATGNDASVAPTKKDARGPLLDAPAAADQGTSVDTASYAGQRPAV